MIGQKLMAESHKLAGWNMSTTSWPDEGDDIDYVIIKYASFVYMY